MAVKQYKPTNPASRDRSVSTFEELTASKPHKPLAKGKKRIGGRNNKGQTTVRFRGGGHKRRYRVVDFKRDKHGVPAKVATVEYDPNRTAHIALLELCRRREALHSLAQRAGSGRGGDLRRGRAGQSGQCAAHSTDPCRHHHPQCRAQDRQGWSVGQKRRGWSAADGQGRQLCPGEAALGRGAQGASGLLRDDRTGRQPGSRQHLFRQGRPNSLAGTSSAQSRRNHEPGRPPDGWWRGQELGWASPLHSVGRSRPRATRPAETSAPTT